MGVNRRQFLLGGLGLAAAATTMGLTGCAPGSSESGGGGGDAGTADLTFAWWGNDVRNKNTTAAIDAYSAANPGVKIAPQPGEWASYWDKLATQVAGNTAPDIIQMDMAYISEYGNRGALLDLSKVDTSKFIEGTVDSGKINDTLYGVNAGINCLVVLVNPEIIAASGEIECEEGCLSVPGYFDKVVRAERVTVRAWDEHGKPFERTAEEMLAVCVQHEMDHLVGRMFVDYLSPLKRARLKNKQRKKQRLAG